MMKMKKILSMGALGLVIATSTSIGAFAAEKPSDETIKKDMETLFQNNTSPLTYNVNKNTKIGSVINLSKFREIVERYKDKGDGDHDKYDKLDTALGLIDDDDTIVDIGVKIVDKFTEEDLDELISEVRSVADRLKEIENGTNEDKDKVNKYEFEKDMKTVIKDSSLKLVFGKNKDGKSTVSVIQGYQIILQLNSGNAYTFNDFINDNADNLADYIHRIKEFLA